MFLAECFILLGKVLIATGLLALFLIIVTVMIPYFVEEQENDEEYY